MLASQSIPSRHPGTRFMCGLALLLSVVSMPVQAQENIDFRALLGKVVYLDFWASWCSPCVTSFPWMQQMHETYSDQGLVVVAVNMDQEPELAEQFLKQYKVAFRIAYLNDGKLAEYFGVETMPTSFLIDRQGNVRFKHAGFHEHKQPEYEAHIRQLLFQSFVESES